MDKGINTAIFEGFTTELNTERKDALEAFHVPAKELQERYDSFLEAYDETVEALEKVEEHVTDTQEQLSKVKADLATETDISKAKRLNDSKNTLEADLELYQTIKKANEEAHAHILYKKGIAVLESATTYEKVLDAFVSCLENTANKETVAGDIKAIQELESFVSSIKSALGHTYIDLGMMEKTSRYVKYEGKSYRVWSYTAKSRTESLTALKQFLYSDDYKYAYYGIQMAVQGGN